MTEKNNVSRPRKASGPDRPTYLDNTDVDRVMAIVLALIAEVASLRERADTHERLGTAGTLPSIDAVEAYRAGPAAEAEREAWRDAYIRRVFRVVTEDIESLKSDTCFQMGDRL